MLKTEDYKRIREGGAVTGELVPKYVDALNALIVWLVENGEVENYKRGKFTRGQCVDWVAEKMQVKRKAVDNYWSKYGWARVLKETFETQVDLRKLGKGQRKVNVGNDGVTEVKVVTYQVERLNLITPDGALKLTDMLQDVREITFSSIQACKDILVVGTMMVRFYGTLIRELMETKGGISKLEPFDLEQIETWNAAIAEHQKRLGEFLKPAAISQYLKLLGVEGIDPNMHDVDKSAYTTKSLQEALLDMGAKSAFEYAQMETFVNFAEGMKGAYGVELPDITGKH